MNWGVTLLRMVMDSVETGYPGEEEEVSRDQRSRTYQVRFTNGFCLDSGIAQLGKGILEDLSTLL